MKDWFKEWLSRLPGLAARNQFWTSVIIAVCVLVALSNKPGMLLFWAAWMYYLIIGGVIWSVRQRKPGLTMITTGGLSALAVVYFWYQLIMLREYTGPGSSIAFAIPLTFLAIALLFGGIRKARKSSIT
ncbi:MAG: hypothetical protein FWF18_03395 [Dehalococcoidia bacterium]|nr:hypothetical protein [Dehalococcoidia bacterium]